MILSLQSEKKNQTGSKEDFMNSRPNILLIMVDDMGYSDIGCYGGEIDTPNLNSLANNGIKFSQFYNSARCCPTRASLLTGLHPHQTGIGHMTNPPQSMSDDLGTYGYRGYINNDSVTMGEVLQQAGYHTYLAGKWHLGQHGKEKWPLQRGFEKFYGIVPGACNYFKPDISKGFVFGNEYADKIDEDFYSTDVFTDYAIKFIDEEEDDNPFFLYLAYNAPHWPLQAKESDVQKYKDKYLCGWDELRKERYKRMLELGVIDKSCKLSPRDDEVRAWNDVNEEKKQEMAYRMAVYAAQIDCIDQNIGRMIDYLKKTDQFDDTLILFLSDNGACAEGGEFGGGEAKNVNKRDIPLFTTIGQAWANASNTPFRRYKHYVHEGGISTPLIAHWPEQIRSQKGTLNHSPSYLIDIMPTILEASGAKYPEVYNGNRIYPIEGSSMIPLFIKGIWQEHELMFWEHESNCTLRKGKWKAIQKYDTGNWELFNLDNDRSELNDLADMNPEVLKLITSKWYELAEKYYVIPKPDGWKF